MKRCIFVVIFLLSNFFGESVLAAEGRSSGRAAATKSLDDRLFHLAGGAGSALNPSFIVAGVDSWEVGMLGAGLFGVNKVFLMGGNSAYTSLGLGVNSYGTFGINGSVGVFWNWLSWVSFRGGMISSVTAKGGTAGEFMAGLHFSI